MLLTMLRRSSCVMEPPPAASTSQTERCWLMMETLKQLEDQRVSRRGQRGHFVLSAVPSSSQIHGSAWNMDHWMRVWRCARRGSRWKKQSLSSCSLWSWGSPTLAPSLRAASSRVGPCAPPVPAQLDCCFRVETRFTLHTPPTLSKSRSRPLTAPFCAPIVDTTTQSGPTLTIPGLPDFEPAQ